MSDDDRYKEGVALPENLVWPQYSPAEFTWNQIGPAEVYGPGPGRWYRRWWRALRMRFDADYRRREVEANERFLDLLSERIKNAEKLLEKLRFTGTEEP